MKKIIYLGVFLMLFACHNKQHSRIDFQSFIAKEGLVQKNRVFQFRFQGWQPLDDRHLILLSSHQKSYLVRLMSSCNDLTYAFKIKLKQDFANTLNAKFDSIIVEDPIFQECTIHSLYEMDKTQKAALLDFANQKDVSED